MDLDRLKHSYGVAKKMQEIGKKLNLNEKEQNNLFIIGLIHDIGYQFTDTLEIHNKVGGEYLKQVNYKYWREIYYHGEINIEYESLYLDLLNIADLQIDKYGEDVGFSNRLIDIKNRYKEDSLVYKKCEKLTEKLKNKYKNILN